MFIYDMVLRCAVTIKPG